MALLACFFLSMAQPAVSQSVDRFVTVRGDTLSLVLTGVEDFKVMYKKPGKEKVHSMSKERVFSVIHANGKEEFIYQVDSLEDNEYSIQQMQHYIWGWQDAGTYHNGWTGIVGLASGVTSAYLGPIFGLIPSGVVIVLIGGRSPRMEGRKTPHPEWMNDEAYVEGYLTRARAKKVRNAAIGSLAGYLAGLVILNNRP
ncbi:MAG: hypothetical protein H6585_12445 [Flavobacteriales bacterium]|nr:hypothetical protein [Flavobacteriales bacterium]MCB9449140.1 hypothetical protein [Flavobacteriales bacterium]